MSLVKGHATQKGKMMKRILICFALLFLFIFLLFSQIDLIKQKDRPVTYHLNKALSEKVSKETAGMKDVDIMKYSVELTASYLRFSSRNDIDHGHANCVGYAQLCAAICNKGLRVNHLKGYAKPVVGYLSLFKWNLCTILREFMPTQRWRNFVKDHDFVEFNFGNDTIYEDASLYDVLGNSFKTLKDE